MCTHIHRAAVVVQAAGKIHARLLARVLRFPLAFFDTTPTGRILNRFAHDVDQVDTQISQALEQQMEWSLRAAIALVLVCSILPSILVFMLPILWSLNRVGQLFRYTSREVRRLDSTTRSPIYAHFSETLSGLSTIRSFGDNGRFALQNEAKVEENLRVWFCHQLTHRWLNMRFDLISLVLQAAAALSCVYFRETMSAGLVGVVMVQSFSSIRGARNAKTVLLVFVFSLSLRVCEALLCQDRLGTNRRKTHETDDRF
jgi:ABC-type multidrug transport system fused ATPase/permease subunit